MDIQKEKFNELFDLWVDVAHKENVKNFGSLMADALKVSLTAMRDVNKNFFDEGVEFAQKVAVPDGFVLMPLEIDDFDHPITKALEKGIVKDLSASVIYKAMIEAQEQVG